MVDENPASPDAPKDPPPNQRQSWSPAAASPATPNRTWVNRRASRHYTYQPPWQSPTTGGGTGPVVDVASLRANLKPVRTSSKKYEFKRPPPPPASPPSFATIRLRSAPKKDSSSATKAAAPPFKPFFATIKLRKTPRYDRKPQQKQDDDDELRTVIAREYGKFIIFSVFNEEIKLRKTKTLRRTYPAGADVPLDTQDVQLRRAERNKYTSEGTDPSHLANLKKTPPRSPHLHSPPQLTPMELRKTTPRDKNCPICQFMEQVDLRNARRNQRDAASGGPGWDPSKLKNVIPGDRDQEGDKEGVKLRHVEHPERDGEHDNDEDYSDDDEEEIHLELEEAQLDLFCEPCKELVQSELEGMAEQAIEAGDTEVVARVKAVLLGGDEDESDDVDQAKNQGQMVDIPSIPPTEPPALQEDLARADKQKSRRLSSLADDMKKAEEKAEKLKQRLSMLQLKNHGGDPNISDHGMSPMGEPEAAIGRGGFAEDNISDSGMSPMDEPEAAMGRGGYGEDNISDSGISPMGEPEAASGRGGFGEDNISDTGMSPMGEPETAMGRGGFGEDNISDTGMSPLGEPDDTESKQLAEPAVDPQVEEQLEKAKRQKERLAGVYMRVKPKPKQELTAEKKRKCYMWYARMSQPNMETMKRRVAKLPPECDITPEDVEMLPWICGGMMLPVKEMNELFLKG